MLVSKIEKIASQVKSNSQTIYQAAKSLNIVISDSEVKTIKNYLLASAMLLPEGW